jgi:hypothetical protein
MKRTELARDYSEFLIRCRMALKNIEIEANKKNYDVAKFMAHELGITAHLMRDALDREQLLKRS